MDAMTKHDKLRVKLYSFSDPLQRTYTYDHWVDDICTYMLFNKVHLYILRNIIKFCFTANGKWSNKYSNSNIQYNTNLFTYNNTNQNKVI